MTEEGKKIRIGISMGDINGISPEVIIKALSDERMYKFCQFVVYGSEAALSYHQKNIANHKAHFNVLEPEAKLSHTKPNLLEIGGNTVIITGGQANDFAGKLALQFLNTALEDLKSGKIDALVTAPLNKSTIKVDKDIFTGHTEYIAKYFNASESMMLMVYNEMRVGLVTNHLPLDDVKKNLNANLITRKIKALHKSLKEDFGLEHPKIAVMGLNPHAGDNGLLGNEEKDIIYPAIQKAKESNILAFGPFAADGFFGTGQYEHFDGVLAMYHDQGLIPFKSISMSEGVNYTAGLPVIRTSPDHGTAYDIVGKDKADYTSMLNSIFYAIDLAQNRISHKIYAANPLQKQSKPHH
jgi:4-hydroxythreonine-4-phosphate dehydrogenase